MLQLQYYHCLPLHHLLTCSPDYRLGLFIEKDHKISFLSKLNRNLLLILKLSFCFSLTNTDKVGRFVVFLLIFQFN